MNERAKCRGCNRRRVLNDDGNCRSCQVFVDWLDWTAMLAIALAFFRPRRSRQLAREIRRHGNAFSDAVREAAKDPDGRT